MKFLVKAHGKQWITESNKILTHAVIVVRQFPDKLFVTLFAWYTNVEKANLWARRITGQHTKAYVVEVEGIE